MSKEAIGNDSEETTQATDNGEVQPYKVRLPGFVSDEDIGLGDVIKRATSYIGVKPCGGCEKRAATLNRWVAFSGRRRE